MRLLSLCDRPLLSAFANKRECTDDFLDFAFSVVAFDGVISMEILGRSPGTPILAKFT